MKVSAKEFPQSPSGAQSLRIRKRLWSFRRGSLAVPAEDSGSAPPLRTNRPSFSRILRDSRLEGSEEILQTQKGSTETHPGGRTEGKFSLSRQNPSSRTGHKREPEAPHERVGLQNFLLRLNSFSISKADSLFSPHRPDRDKGPLCFLILFIRPTSVPGRQGILPCDEAEVLEWRRKF